MKVESIPSSECYQWIMRKHYAHRMPCVKYAYGLYGKDGLEGVVTYGPTPTPAVQENICGKKYRDIVIELNRLCVDSKEKNASSILVGGSLRLLPKPSIVVSYADGGMGHVGYIYQATNFIYTGAVTAHDSEYIIDGKKVHARSITAKGITAVKEWAKKNGIEEVKPKPKNRYVYFVGSKKERKQMINSLTYPIINRYPKGKTLRYDATAKVEIQQTLF